jgi:hypothetical protein
MSRAFLAVVMLAGGLLAAGPALASGDFECVPAWKVRKSERTECDNLPFLSPGNDSRVNLQLLLMDAGAATLHAPADVQAGAPSFSLDNLNAALAAKPPQSASDESSDRAQGEGSRCSSNAAGIEAFKAEMTATTGLPAAEREALTAARAAVRADCAEAGQAAQPPPTAVRSALGRQFALYLAGSAAFYGGDWDRAQASFAALKSSAQPWLRETARYMLGRVEINRAQGAAFDEYGALHLEKVDAAAVAAAGAAFRDYLRDYPNGAYAASARGLLRRVDWLAGRPADLAADLARAFAVTDPRLTNVSEVQLTQEADSKLLAGAQAASIREPVLLATLDLMGMRTSQGPDAPKPIARAALEAQRPLFAGRAALFDYLLAAHALYDENDPAAAVARLGAAPAASPRTSLDLSRQVLRGLALEASGDHAGAQALWRGLLGVGPPPLQRPMLEMALAMNLERGGALAQVFAAGSPVTSAPLREILLRHDAGPDLLRRQAASGTDRERQIALYALLWKEVTRGRYQAFLADLTLMPPAPPARAEGSDATGPDPDFAPFRFAAETEHGYPCPDLRQIAADLARDPRRPQSQLCLSEWVRLTGLDDTSLDVTPPTGELGGVASEFPGPGYSRLESYRQLLADARTGADERAYVLYRAIRCYASAGQNHCTGPGVSIDQRKEWFHTLKTRFPGSPWAAQLKYYW